MLASHHTEMMETSLEDGISNYVVLYLYVGVAISLGMILYKLWQSVTCSNKARNLTPHKQNPLMEEFVCVDFFWVAGLLFDRMLNHIYPNFFI